MIELEARNALSGRCDGRLRELSQLTAINEGFQNILLDVEVVIVDLRQRFLESRQIFDGFVDAVIVDVVARGLGPRDDVIANVLLDEAVAIVAANHRIWKVDVLDLVCGLPRYCLVTLRPKITVILFGCPIVRLASSRRWPRLSSAARRWKMRLSQYSICEKNSRCWQPACSRSLAVKKGVRCANHF